MTQEFKELQLKSTIKKHMGVVYNELTITRVFRDSTRYTKAECKCSCGTVMTKRLSSITSGNAKSCGHIRIKHGMTRGGVKKSRLFNIYDNMVQRCYNPNNTAYIYYGAKGVTICDEWLNDSMAFFKWAKEHGYKDTLEIDKDRLCSILNITPKLYSPKTCEWILPTINKDRKRVY